ncbi:hypothetical protein M413DRAFT_15322 [Hebeloma cylindrosporum]|uniref:UEV domain-containing protein n=1 Tax=Hebeloma cylindrosporum TaxID=76867 RepID=A0A0C3CKC9_HEBCY|nr:hypothetical protein M413DRAFT_15322 [Hebeloma cylindrosporum h7]
MASLTQKWLRDCAQPYPNPHRVYADIDAALARFTTLRPKSDVYTFDDGRTQLLLCLHGLLPITFRNVSYNIPIALWVTRDYPRQSPIVYVVPTNDMIVKSGKYVDVSGRCNIEYIQHWDRKPEGCSLSALLEALQDHFSRAPPLYSKPTNQAPSKPLYRSPPPIPQPLPPSPPPRVLGPASPPPPPPPLPPQTVTHVPIFAPEPPRPPIPDLLDENDSSPPANYVSFPAPPPRPPNPELLSLHQQVHHKLSSELNSLSQALALDAERLRAQQSDLLAGEPAIKDEMARLEAVRDVCRTVANRTRQAVQQAESNIAELRRKGDPEVDELVCATSIVHNQLINLIADDNAIEDTIYHLHRALNAGRIDLERFLRSTRVLAEEQFMKRALIEKIQSGVSTMSSSSIAPD